MCIHGFSIFMSLAQIPFQFGFTIGGHGLTIRLMFSIQRPKKVGTFGSKAQAQWNPTWGKYNSLDNLTLLRFSIANTDYVSIFRTLSHYLWFAFMRSNCGLSLRPSYVAKKMLKIFARQKPRSLLSTICISLKSKQKLSPQHLQRKRAHLHQQSPKPKDYHKRNVIF